VGTFVALLRGVNIGKAKRVPMERLRALLAGLGYTDVRTLLNSGNAVFRSTSRSPAACAGAIEGALAGELEVAVPVVVLSARTLDRVVAGNPFAGAADPSRLLVAFTQEAADLASLRAIEPLVAPAEGFAIGSDAAYLYCAAGILQSKAGEALLGRLGRSATTRNWATTLKLHALAGAGA
jgi:uncharacterized protein (DUF1697 family)